MYGKRVNRDLCDYFRIADLSELDSFNTALPLCTYCRIPNVLFATINWQFGSEQASQWKAAGLGV